MDYGYYNQSSSTEMFIIAVADVLWSDYQCMEYFNQVGIWGPFY